MHYINWHFIYLFTYLLTTELWVGNGPELPYMLNIYNASENNSHQKSFTYNGGGKNISINSLNCPENSNLYVWQCSNKPHNVNYLLTYDLSSYKNQAIIK